MNRSLLRNILSLLSLQGANYLLPLLTLPYLVRTLGTEAYGRLGFSLAFIQYFVLLADYGFNLSATRAIAQHQQDRQRVSQLFWNVTACKLLLGLIGFSILSLLSQLIPTLHAVQDVLLAAYLLVLGSILFPVWLFQGMETMGRIAICSLLAKALVVPATFLFVHRPEDAWLAAAIQGITTVAAGLLAIGFIHRERWIVWTLPTLNGLKEQLAEGWHVFLSTAAISLYTASTTVILGFLAGNTAVGHFVAADRIRQATQGLISPVSQAVYPRVNALMQQDRHAAFQMIRRLLWGQGGVTLLLSLLLMGFAPLIIALAYGVGHQDTVTVLRWLAPLPFVIGLSNVLGIQTMLTLGMEQLFSRILLASGLCSLILIVPLSLYHGATGAATAVLITECLVTCTMSWVLYSRQIPLFKKDTCHAV